MSFPPLRVGAVPEHFSYPLHIALSHYPTLFTLSDQRCGTGEMISNLKNHTLDLVIALTEGIVSDIAKGSEVRMWMDDRRN